MEARPSTLSEAELALFRELDARGVKYYVGGLLGAALRGVAVRWELIGLYVAKHTDDYAAAIRASGIPRDAIDRNKTYSRIREVIYRAEGRFHAQHATASTILVGTTPIRVQSLDGIRDDIDYYFGSSDERALIAGLSQLPADQRPETVAAIEVHLGTLIGRELSTAELAPSSAGYQHSRSHRAGTYERYYDGDVNPRTGESSAAIAIYEHPDRPVVAAVRRALGWT